MATFVAFLRAINLGATRKFSKESIIAATEAAGGTEVETWINTGNVRLTSPRRSPERVAADLEAAFAEAAGFEVPTVVFTLPELAGIVADADQCAAEHPGFGQHHVSLLKQTPAPDAVREFEARWSGDPSGGPRARVLGRGAHLLLPAASGYHGSSLTNASVERALGVATARNVRVIRTVALRWA